MSFPTNNYTARFRLPDFLPKGKNITLSCPVYLDGTLTAPTSGTVSVVDQDGSVVVDEASITVASSIATYALSGTLTSTKSVGDMWQVLWTLTIGGVEYQFENEASLVIRPLRPAVSDIDLFQRHPMLDPNAFDKIGGDLTTYQPFINEAWIEIISRLISEGKKPYLISGSTALQSIHLYLSLALVFQALSGPTDTYADEKERYFEMYKEMWTTTKFPQDTDADGKPDTKKSTGIQGFWS